MYRTLVPVHEGYVSHLPPFGGYPVLMPVHYRRDVHVSKRILPESRFTHSLNAASPDRVIQDDVFSCDIFDNIDLAWIPLIRISSAQEIVCMSETYCPIEPMAKLSPL